MVFSPVGALITVDPLPLCTMYIKQQVSRVGEVLYPLEILSAWAAMVLEKWLPQVR